MRRLEMKAYPYLFVDVRYEKVRVGGRVVRIFPNRGACLRLVTALAIEQSEEWLSGRRYLDLRELEEQRRQEEQKTEEVALMERQRKDEARRKLHKPQVLTDKYEDDRKITSAHFQSSPCSLPSYKSLASLRFFQNCLRYGPI
jgi:hypothetical protein